MKINRSINSLSLGLLACAFAVSVGSVVRFLPVVWPAIVTAQSISTGTTQQRARTLFFRDSGGEGSMVNSGGARLLRRGIVAVRDDGTFVEKSAIIDRAGQVISSYREMELASGIRIDVDDITQVVVAVKRSQEERAIARRDNITPGCVAPTKQASAEVKYATLGREDIAGQSAFGSRAEGPSFVLMSWRVPAIGCEEMKRVMFFKDRSGAITDWSERLVERVIPGEPDAALFHIPDSYARVTYAEKYRREVAELGEIADPKELEYLARVDERTKNSRYEGPLP